MIESLPSQNLNTPSSRTGLPHVLLVVDQFPRVLGGGERIVLKLASLLPSYGFRVSILTFFIHPESTVSNSVPCPLYVLPLQRTYDFKAIKAALHLRRFIRKQHVQIVQTFFESSDIWAGAVTKLFSRAKLIWSRRDMGILRGRKHHVAYRMLAHLPDAVFAVSEQVRKHCVEVDRVDADRVHTIYNGLDLSTDPAERTMDPARAIVATVGNIRRVKGHDVLIRAAALVVQRFPGVRFSIAGAVLEQAYFDELNQLLDTLDLSDKFEFAGNIMDLPQYLTGADIFVLPSRSEGFSNALIEAMAAGLPVIASDVGGNGEAIQEDVNGFLIPSEDPGALAEALIKVLSDPERGRRMGIEGRALAAKHFTTEAMMSKTVGIYQELLNRTSQDR